MNRFHSLMRWAWSFIVVFTLAFSLSGCEGDDGAPGADGADGATGPAGPTGPEGPAGPGAAIVPLESCAVCHDDGSFASAPAAHEVFDVGAFADFAVAPDTAVPADLIVSFSVTVDGAAATAATFRRAYVSTGGVVRTSLTDEVELDPTLFTNNGDGTYSLRIVDGVARFGADNSRYLVVVLNGLNALEVAAVGDYPAPIPLAGLADSNACVNCHGASGEAGRFDPENRGGHYSAPMSAEACIVCHRPDDPSTPDDDEEPSYMQFFRVVHGIHNSHEMPGGEFVTDRDNVYHITYPTYMTNCSVCHSDETIVPATGGSALAAANAMPVTGRGCLSCHGSMDSWTFPESLSFHDLITDPLTHDCQTACHEPGGLGQAKVAVAAFHNGLTTGRGGIIWDGVDTSVTEGALFDWEILGVELVDVDGVASLAIDWQASYDSIPVDPCNETLGPGAPTFHAAVDADGDFTGNLSMLRNYAQGDDFILGQSTSAPGQALSVNVTVDNTTCTSLVATTTIPADDVTAERGIVALQGKPRTVSPDPAGPAEGQRVRAKTPTYEFMVADGSAPVAMRRDIVDTSECLKCHVGSLYQHGGNRVDNVGMCILCHNSASNEKNVRVGMGVDPSEAYDGRAGQTFEMKTMLHRIHSSGVEGLPPYVIYRNRGIYAFASSDTLLPNWPGTGEQVVFGSNDVTTNHNFHAPTYPRALNACSACHVPTLPVQPDQTKAMASTQDAGSEVWEDQLDDVLQGAATTACVTCHATGPAKGHAYQNSWQPQEFEEGRQTIIDAVN